MRLRALSVRDFRCIEAADVTFHDGLNVLHGPNDLGKSSLVEAIRAALLLQHSSKQGSDYKPWGTDRVPQVELQLSDDTGRWWRVRKAFSTGRRGSATLEWSNDGTTWTLQDKNRGVDGKLRELLAWGVPDAGAKGGRGAPSSFLATILVGPQMQPGAVFNTSLADDKVDTGRERLGEALQALAEDPLFKAVLDRAQDLVERAFTKDDRKRNAKDSPFRPLQDRIKDLTNKLQELSAQVFSSENVRQQLASLQRELDAAMSERDQAVETRTAMEAVWEVQTALAVAQADLDAIAAQHREIERLRDQQHELLRERPAAEAAVRTDQDKRAAAQRALDDALRAVEEIEQGGDAEGKLHKQSLQTRRLEVQAACDKAYERLQRAASAQAQQTALDSLADDKRRTDDDLRAKSDEAAGAERRRRHAEATRKALDGALELRRLQEAEARLTEAEAAVDSARTLRDQAAALRSQADRAQAELAVRPLPSVEAIAALRDQQQALRVAEARLGGGLSLRVRHCTEAASVRAAADDAPLHALADGEAIAAGRRITIEVGPDVVLEVVGGEAEARAHAEALRTAWTQDALPVLQGLSVTTIDALEALARTAQQTLAQATAQRTAADAAEQRAQTYDAVAADRDARQAAVRRRGEALAGLDRAQLQRDAGELDESALLQQRNRSEATMDEEARAATLLTAEVAELKADADAKTRRLDDARRALQVALAALPGDIDALVDRARDEHAALQGRLEQVQQEIVDAERQSAGRLQRAQAAVEAAQTTLKEAGDVQAKAVARLEAISVAAAQVEGQLQAQVARAEQSDAVAARTRVQTLREQLAAFPAAEQPVDQDALARARQHATQAAARVRELDKALASQRGELKQVGGNVVLEDRAETEQALNVARADEVELELDFDAYKLLLDVMRQAESAEGRHLGQALAGPVRERFTQLTAGRYGALRLNADLDAQGLEAAGGLRSIDALSAGLQEQLATLLRLAVAEQLDSALVLDDHLTQTDPARILWFRRALLETATKTQVVVMTCRQDDYLGATVPEIDDRAVTETPPVHVVDLAAVIRRVPTAADLPAAD